MSNPIGYFLDSLEKWEYHYPLPSQWAVSITKIPSGISGIEQNNQRAYSIDNEIKQLEHQDWELNNALPALLNDEVLKQEGIECFFVDSVNLAPENAGASSTSIGGGNINGGIIPGLISNGRADFSARPLTIGFRETAHSFADFVIRPWIILAAHLGRIADRNSEIKTDIVVYSFGKSYPGKNKPEIRKVYTYYGCVPSKVDSISLKYGDDSMITYSTEWYFDRYSISAPPTSKQIEQGRLNQQLQSELRGVPERAADRTPDQRERLRPQDRQENRRSELRDEVRGPQRRSLPLPTAQGDDFPANPELPPAPGRDFLPSRRRSAPFYRF